MKKFLLNVIFCVCLLQMKCFAISLDNSIDDEINKKYNTNQLEETLPKLPQGLEPTDYQPNTSIVSKKNNNNDEFIAIKIPRGTKFRTVSANWASDGSNVGSVVKFTTTKPVTKRYITIPAGSVLRGRVVDSHLPQYSANGGLVKIEIENISINGSNRSAEGKIVKANGKNIFFNNIKGKRKYLIGMGKSIKKSHRFFQKAMKKTSQYASDGLTVILSPFTFVGGLAGYLGGVILSPVTALNYKGERVSLPPNTLYTIKLTKDVYIYE